jgi:formylglycine-generating enzyme required for sulfatase activity
MGAEGGEDGYPEGPVHQVRIGSSFAAGRTEVTQEQFAAFVVATRREMPGGCRIWDGTDWQHPADADWTNPGYGRVPFADEPVTCVTWQDARDYVAWLAKLTGKPYRLLSEAEWEYLARAGPVSDMPCKEANVYDQSGARQNKFDWEPLDCDDGYGLVAPVGSFAANAFGLRDLLGNVWEWTADCYIAPYPATPADGSPVAQGMTETGECAFRSVRGGSWSTGPGWQRVTFRGRDPERARYAFFGIRVARDLR